MGEICLKKGILIALLSLLCLLIVVPNAFALDNQTEIAVNDSDVLSDEYYFDIHIENDTGDGSKYNPYKEFIPERIKDNSILHLAEGVYTLTNNIKANNITVIGQSPQKTIISYTNTHDGLNCRNSLILTNLTLVNLPITNSGNLTATNVLFYDSHATKGGAINSINYGDVVSLNNCTFINTNAEYGGALYVGNCALNIRDTLFINNYATLYGGAIYCDSKTEITIKKSKFLNVNSKNAGGAVYVYESENFTGSDLEFINCTSGFGGAITLLNSFTDLNNVTAKNNNAKYFGGAIYSMYRSLSIVDSLFDNNSALNGGAVYADGEEIFLISNNKFMNNVALNNAGAVYSLLSDTYEMSILTDLNNSFYNNKASLNNDVCQTDDVDLIIGNGNYSLIKYVPTYNGTLPTSYDLRQLGYVTPVKDQKNGGNCWAFSVLSSLESCLLKALNVSYDLSESNMKNIMALFSDYGWYMDTNEGGYDKMGIAYLTSWLGPVYETDDPYNSQNVLSPVLNSIFHIQNVQFITRTDYNDNDAVKIAIMEYGAVSTSAYWSSSNLKGKNYYYAGSSSANHAVSVVGWDDDYSRYNFKTTPPGDGAWIIKNSWGTNSGDKGYYYVSYYDARLIPLNKPESTFTFVFNDTIKFDKSYQYDIPGRTDILLNTTDTVWYKNKFVAAEDEYLAAVSTYFSKETSWDLSIYVNNVLKLTKSGKSLPSYLTINLDQYIPLKSGDSFEIIFKITVDGDVGVPISEEISLNKMLYKENISYISYDGVNWQDLYDFVWLGYPDHTYNSQVACIKAFTFFNPINSILSLDLTNIRTNQLDIIANVVDEYGNLIKWGEVTFNIEGVEKTVKVENGIAKIENVAIKLGINKFSAKFSGNAYANSSTFVSYSKTLINTDLSLSFSSLESNPIEITATVTDVNGNYVECGEVTFNIDGLNYTVDVVNGVASIVKTFAFGTSNISAVYRDAYSYNSSNDEKSIVVNGLDTFISLSVVNQYNPIVISVDVVDENGLNVNRGYVRFSLDNQNYLVNVSEGKASIEYLFKRLSGSKKVSVDYYEDSFNYCSSSNYTYVDVLLKPATLDLNVDSGNYQNPVEIVATVKDDDNNPVNSGVVRFNICGKWYDVNVVNGTAALQGTFSYTGLNDVIVSYDGLYYYTSSQKEICLNISKIPVVLSLNVEKSSDNIKFIFTSSQPIDEYVVTYINDVFHLIKLNNGTAVYESDFNPGKYVIDANLAGYVYQSLPVHEEIIVTRMGTAMICEDLVGYVSRNNHYSIILKDEFGNFISHASVALKVNGKTYNEFTDESGTALFKLDLDVGQYGASFEYDGNDKYMNSSAARTVIIKSTISMASQTQYTYDSNYVATLLDSNGNPLKNKEISLGIGDKIFSAHTDSNGVLSYNLKLSPASYEMNVVNLETGEVKYQIIKVVKRITSNKDLTMYYGAGKSYTVRVYDDHGNVLKNAKVAFKVNGKTYYRYSDENGYASLKISLNPNTYTITATYKGFKVSNKVVVKSTLILSTKTVKKSKTFKYTVKLLNSNGKILKNKKVKVKFRGKTYTAKTNSKGIANFKIKSLSKTGKFSLTASYGTLKISKTITIKK